MCIRDRRELADKAGVSLRAIHNLEAGAGSTLGTFLRGLKALNAVDVIETLVPVSYTHLDVYKRQG